MGDIFDVLEGFAPEVAEDKSGFEPFTCGGVGIIVEGGRNTGVKESTGDRFDWFKIKYKIGEVIDGDAKSIGRFDDLSYSMTDKTWPDGGVSKGEDNLTQLISDLHTMGFDFKTIAGTEEEKLEALAMHLGSLVDKTFNVRCAKTKKGNQWRMVVGEIKARGKPKGTEEVPF